MSRKNNLIWIDLEMTGLNPEYNRIIEIATVITDSNLNILAEGPVCAIYQSDEELTKMNIWNKKTHFNSGLIQQVKESKFNENTAENLTLDFLKKWVPAMISPICGNSVSQDRRFLFKYMPRLESYFHYRCLDVSTLKELACRWNPKILTKLNKNNKHHAINDIYASISELIYYRTHFIRL